MNRDTFIDFLAINVAALFLYQLSIGGIINLALMPLKQVDQKFYQLSSGLNSLLVAIGLALSFFYPLFLPKSFHVEVSNLTNLAWWGKIALLVYLLIIFVLYIRMRLKKLLGAKVLVRLAAILGVISLAIQGLIYRPANFYEGFRQVLIPLDLVTGAMFLGVFMLAMVFGHWYLVKSMPKKLLRRMAEILIVILIVRVLVVALTMTVYGLEVEGGSAAISLLMSFADNGQGMFFWMRTLIGLFIPLILSFMIWSTAKIGANQSATGLLYVGVVFVIIGEMCSKYLFLVSGIPV